jgi:parvulin-like peptidyl-prolyl isomerase
LYGVIKDTTEAEMISCDLSFFENIRSFTLKKHILLAVAFFTAFSVSAQIIGSSRRAATVNLYDTEIIFTQELDEKFEQLQREFRLQGQNLNVTKADVLQGMISDILILQAALEAEVSITNAELQNRIAMEKAGLEQAYQRSLTAAEFQTLAVNRYGSYEAYQESIRNQEIMKKYIFTAKQDIFSALRDPAESVIQEAYRKNKLSFVRPRFINFQHITVDTRNLSGAELDAARASAEAILRNIRNGIKSFDDYVKEFEAGTVERRTSGMFGWIGESEAQFETIYGRTFFNSIFQLKDGVVSQVIESNVGFHILLLDGEVEEKILDLDDQISPRSSLTVRQQILNVLNNQQLSDAFQRATKQLIEELREQATIRIYDENL